MIKQKSAVTELHFI